MVATTVVVLGARPSGAQPIDPSVTVDRTGTAAGEQMLITGGGWPNGATLIVELCGHGGLRGSVDCDVSHQRTAGVGPSGTFSVELTTGRPPTPCPCVVKATDQTTQIAATAPIAVAGIPTVPITDANATAPARALEISSIEVTGGGTWAELFGAGGRRVLEVTLVNTGPLPIDAPDVSVAWGRGSQPDGFVRPPDTERMEPGDTQTLTVGLDRPALTLGEQTAVVEVQGLGEVVTGRAATSGYPWGLLAVALVVLQLLLLRLRNRMRRRLGRRSAAPVEAPTDEGAVLALPPGPAALPAPVPDEVSVVIDLDELEPEVPAPAQPERAAVNGERHAELMDGQRAEPVTLDLVPVSVTSLAVAPDAAPDVVAARAELRTVQLQARLALKHAIELSENLVAASAARVNELEAEAAGRLRAAAARHAEAIELLEAARARADEVRAAASDAAASALRDATADRTAAHQALAELEEQGQRLVDAARAAIDGAITDLDDRLRALPAPLELEADGDRAAAPATGTPAPRLGGLDLRVAAAVSRALASTSMPADPTG
jgi:hypothetical protein